MNDGTREDGEGWRKGDVGLMGRRGVGGGEGNDGQQGGDLKGRGGKSK
jgi:hypothetical protein